MRPHAKTFFFQLKNRTNKLNSFCLTVRDRKGLVERWEEQNHVCLNVTASLPHLALDPSDQVFRISLKDRDRMEAPIVAYLCDSRLKPIPIVSLQISPLFFIFQIIMY